MRQRIVALGALLVFAGALLPISAQDRPIPDREALKPSQYVNDFAMRGSQTTIQVAEQNHFNFIKCGDRFINLVQITSVEISRKADRPEVQVHFVGDGGRVLGLAGPPAEQLIEAIQRHIPPLPEKPLGR